MIVGIKRGGKSKEEIYSFPNEVKGKSGGGGGLNIAG